MGQAAKKELQTWESAHAKAAACLTLDIDGSMPSVTNLGPCWIQFYMFKRYSKTQ